MIRLRVFLAEYRVERLTRDMLRHGERHCVGVDTHCPKWAAINDLYDQAVDQLRALKA